MAVTKKSLISNSPSKKSAKKSTAKATGKAATAKLATAMIAASSKFQPTMLTTAYKV